MRIVVTGGTGLVGGTLCDALRRAGHEVTVISRTPRGDGWTVGWEDALAAVARAEAVVNLAGEPLAARWTAARKERIRSSRVEATRMLVDALAAAAPARPRVFVSASAIGYYGPHGDEELDETCLPGTDFLAEVCKAWEAEARRAEALGLRVVRLRIGVVLAPDGGALPRMALPFRLFAGGPVGNGRQWMSWIHRDDVVGLIIDAVRDERYTGAINATAPAPARNRDVAAALGQALHRPALLPAPALALRLALGEMATLLLTGQRVLPRAARKLGYAWRYPELDAALRACV